LRIRIKSPTIGTFHWVKLDNGESIARSGQYVKTGEIIAYINALGLNIEILSPINGNIDKVVIYDNMPVEYGQVFVIITVTK